MQKAGEEGLPLRTPPTAPEAADGVKTGAQGTRPPPQTDIFVFPFTPPMNRLALLLLLALPFSGCDSNEPIVQSCENESREIEVEDLVIGTSPAQVAVTDFVRMNYVGQLEDGTEFDSATNYTQNVSIFVPGFRQGVTGMRIGSKRRITIPPYLGYGTLARTRTVNGEEVEVIPSCSTLIFEVELLDILS